MLTKKIVLTITLSAISLWTYTLYGQFGSKVYKDTSQKITREELKNERASHKERLLNVRKSKKQTRAEAKIAKQGNSEAKKAARDSNKAYRGEKKLNNRVTNK